MTPQQELEETTRNSLLKASGPDGDLIRDFAAQMRQDRAAIMAAVILEAVKPEPLTEARFASLNAQADADLLAMDDEQHFSRNGW